MAFVLVNTVAVLNKFDKDDLSKFAFENAKKYNVKLVYGMLQIDQIHIDKLAKGFKKFKLTSK